MLASYLLSRTLIPTLVMYIMRGHEHRAEGAQVVLRAVPAGIRAQVRGFPSRLRGACWKQPWSIAECSPFAFCILRPLAGLWSCFSARISSRTWMPDCFVCMCARAPDCGWRKRRASAISRKFLREQIPPGQLQTILDNIGLPNSGINQSYSSNGTIGTSDAEILVGLNPEHHPPPQSYAAACAKICRSSFPAVEFFFQPADIVTQILNFGLPAPIDIQLVGTNMQQNYEIAQEIANRLRHVPGAADVHVQQLLSLPTLQMDIERTRVTQVGLTARDVAQSVLVSLSGSFQTSPNFWLNPQESGHVSNRRAVAAIPYD